MGAVCGTSLSKIEQEVLTTCHPLYSIGFNETMASLYFGLTWRSQSLELGEVDCGCRILASNEGKFSSKSYCRLHEMGRRTEASSDNIFILESSSCQYEAGAISS
jgi:hypothetical protein